MAIYCSREIIEAIRDMSFPKKKLELINYIRKNDKISEASEIALNKLEDKTYHSFEEVCENIKIVCDLEIMNLLKNVKFPTTKKEIISYAKSRELSALVLDILEDLPDWQIFKSLSDICK